MCELTFADLGELNKQYILHQTIINARNNNNDGVGMIQDGMYWKSKHSAQALVDYGSFIKKEVDTSPVAFHVRYATNKKLNEDCNSHPFPTDYLIVMHNGKLQRKDGKPIPADKVDSEVFAECLNAKIVESPDISIVDLLNDVMKDWFGKFAFIIYDLRDSNYYIVRGWTANLHWSTINGKLVVNTVKADLEKAMHDFRMSYQLQTGKDLKLGEIKELETETIYKFDPKKGVLTKIGELEENRAPLRTTRTQNTYSGVQTLDALTNYGNQNRDPMFKQIHNWMTYNGVTLPDLNEISLVVMGCSLLELTTEDIDVFYSNVLRALEKKVFDDTFEVWKAIRKIYRCAWAYEQEGFVFPWMLNSPMAMTQILKLAEADKEEEDKKKEAKNKTL